MITRRTDLSAFEARRLLTYDPVSGVIFWKVKRAPHISPGDVAGHVDVHGYRVICVCGVLYKAHRIAWLLFHGRWPGDDLDHANGERADNRLANLREVSRSQNNANSRLRASNKCGSKGVHLVRGCRWRAVIRIGGKGKHLGYFGTQAEAAAAYASAANEAFGECARAA